MTSSSMKYHHIGVACFDIDATADKYTTMGYSKGNTIYDPIQNVNICFLSHPEMPCVELLAPVDENSPVNGTLQKNGTGPYHTCYEVENLEDSVKKLRKLRYMIVKKPEPACAIDNRRVCFLFHKDMGLIELVESTK